MKKCWASGFMDKLLILIRTAKQRKTFADIISAVQMPSACVSHELKTKPSSQNRVESISSGSSRSGQK